MTIERADHSKSFEDKNVSANIYNETFHEIQDTIT